MAKRTNYLHLAVLVACGCGGSGVRATTPMGDDSGAPPPADDAGMPEAPARPPSHGCVLMQPTAAPPNLSTNMWTDISPAGFKFGDKAQVFLTQGMAVDTCSPSTIYVALDGFDPAAFKPIPAGLFKTTDG